MKLDLQRQTVHVILIQNFLKLHRFNLKSQEISDTPPSMFPFPTVISHIFGGEGHWSAAAHQSCTCTTV